MGLISFAFIQCGGQLGGAFLNAVGSNARVDQQMSTMIHLSSMPLSALAKGS